MTNACIAGMIVVKIPIKSEDKPMRDKILKIFYDHSTVLPEGKCTCGWEPIVEVVGDLVCGVVRPSHRCRNYRNQV